MFKFTRGLICFLFVITSSFYAYSINGRKDLSEKPIKKHQSHPQSFGSVKNIFYNIPSPIEVTEIMRKMDLMYQPDIMNPVSNADNYLSQADKAVNLGIYGADLSYIRIYEQFQDAARYLLVVKKFNRELGIPEDQERRTVQRVSNNIDNQDSLLQIISETFTKSDSYLKDNQRGSTAALIIFGGWVETLYLATNIIDIKNPQKEMIELIAQQKYSVKNLIGLLSRYRNEEKIQMILPDLKTLDAKFREIEQVKTTPSGVKSKNGKAFIQNKVSLNISPKAIQEISDINNKIRAKLTEL